MPSFHRYKAIEDVKCNAYVDAGYFEITVRCYAG